MLLCVLYTAGDAFRDPTNGCYCDHFAFDGSDPVSSRAEALSGAVCDGQQYSSAATGMGLVATCAFAEMGLLSAAEAERRALQTLESLATLWPREKFSGFFVHFCDRASPMFRPTAEYSTVDTAEMVMGALFAGNYFGGAVQRVAQKLAAEVNWSVAIESATSPTIYPVINAVSPRIHARAHLTHARACVATQGLSLHACWLVAHPPLQNADDRRGWRYYSAVQRVLYSGAHCETDGRDR